MSVQEKGLFREASQLPTVAVTMGDAAGIGPEIILKILADGDLRRICRIAVIGDLAFLRRAADSLGLSAALAEAERETEIVDMANLPLDLEIGRDSAQAGRASAEYIERAVELWREGHIDAVCTAPISKAALSLGGYKYPGHTEFLAELTGTKEFAMSFFAGQLRVVLLSTHLSLRSAIELVQTENLARLIRFTAAEMSKLLNRTVSIAVAGLNPHASEGGMFGNEEEIAISPAIAECRAGGLEVSGPYSPDTVFLRGFRGEFDAVIACYHDQATIAVKSLSFGSSVNVTLGLPLIRTSVDHGTAFDIAGRGIADASSMKAAVKLAAELAMVRIGSESRAASKP